MPTGSITLHRDMGRDFHHSGNRLPAGQKYGTHLQSMSTSTNRWQAQLQWRISALAPRAAGWGTGGPMIRSFGVRCDTARRFDPWPGGSGGNIQPEFTVYRRRHFGRLTPLRRIGSGPFSAWVNSPSSARLDGCHLAPPFRDILDGYYVVRQINLGRYLGSPMSFPGYLLIHWLSTQPVGLIGATIIGDCSVFGSVLRRGGAMCRVHDRRPAGCAILYVGLVGELAGLAGGFLVIPGDAKIHSLGPGWPDPVQGWNFPMHSNLPSARVSQPLEARCRTAFL